MKPLKFFLDFFLFSNIFISLSAAALTVESYLLFNAEINWLYTGFVFSSSIVLYNCPSLLFSGTEHDSQRQRWILLNKKLIRIITIGAFAATCGMVFFFPFRLILWFVPVTILSFAYFLPITNFRAIPVVKAVAVAFVWTCVTYYFPLFLFSGSFTDGKGWSETVRFSFLLALAVAFNIRDIEIDRRADVKTFPVIFGIRKTKIISVFFTLIFCISVFLTSYSAGVKSVMFFSAFITAVLISFASEKRPEYFYTLWMDGMILFQFLLVLAAVTV